LTKKPTKKISGPDAGERAAHLGVGRRIVTRPVKKEVVGMGKNPLAGR